MDSQKIGDEVLVLVGMAVLLFLLLSIALYAFFLRFRAGILKQQAQLRAVEQQHQQHLLSTVIKSQEAERLRISKELHDHVGSSLSHLRLLAAHIEQVPDLPARLQAMANGYKTSIDGIMNDVRTLSHNLSPSGLELWGLAETVADYCQQYAEVAGFEVSIGMPTSELKLPFDTSLNLYRVVQELLNNTSKYARATYVELNFESQSPNQLVVTYRDNGRGTDQNVFNSKGIGMYNVESRLKVSGASYEVKSAIGQGFEFKIFLPLDIDTLNNGK